MKIEVIEIYPLSSDKKHEKGTVHIHLRPYGLEIKNIAYFVRKKKKPKVFIKLPFRKYKQGKEEVCVPDVTFENVEDHKKMLKAIQKEVMENL